MISNVEKGKLFQEKCKDLLEREFGRKFESEVRLGLSDGRFHRFDLATAERDVVAECKAYTWTASGKTPSSKIIHLREALDLLSNLHDSTRTFLVMQKDQHPSRNETLAQYFVRINKNILKRVTIIELGEKETKITYLHRGC